MYEEFLTMDKNLMNIRLVYSKHRKLSLIKINIVGKVKIQIKEKVQDFKTD